MRFLFLHFIQNFTQKGAQYGQNYSKPFQTFTFGLS